MKSVFVAGAFLCLAGCSAVEAPVAFAGLLTDSSAQTRSPDPRDPIVDPLDTPGRYRIQDKRGPAGLVVAQDRSFVFQGVGCDFLAVTPPKRPNLDRVYRVRTARRCGHFGEPDVDVTAWVRATPETKARPEERFGDELVLTATVWVKDPKGRVGTPFNLDYQSLTPLSVY